MNPSSAELNNKLAELEHVKGVAEFDIETSIREIKNSESEDEPCPEWKYEVMAFGFCENYPDKNGGWGTYFGPMTVFPTDDGKILESPSISLVDQNVIDYWLARSKETSNPLLKARYAGLVWDLSERATGKPANFISAIDSAEALIRIAEEGLHKYHVDVVQKLERAMSIALSINNALLIKRAKNAILDYESHIADDSKPGLWGFSFDLLVGNKKVNLSAADEKKIIGDLEGKLARLQNGDPWACEHAAERLARYYRARNLDKETTRVIRSLGNTFEKAAARVAPLVASSWLEHLQRIYIQFNLKNEAEHVAKAIRVLGPKVRDDMKPFSHTTEISAEVFEQYVEQFLLGDVEDSLKTIAIGYIPNRGEIEEQLHDLAKDAPLRFRCTTQITDYQGRVVGKIGSLEDDLDGHVVHQMSQNLGFFVVFLGAVLDRAIEKYDIRNDKMVEYIFQSPAFTEQQREFISAGVAAYLQNQFHVAIHLLVPQIEAAFRNIVEKSGGAVLKPGREWGFHLKTLDELLRSREINNALGDDVVLYMRVLLTDQRGWNVRNEVCHGLSLYEHMSEGVADRLMHVLLLLALLRAKEV